MFFSSLIGIDFGSSNLKLVELRGKGRRKLFRLGLQPINQDSILGGVVNDEEGVSKSLAALVKRMGIATFGRRVALSLGGTSVIIKKIEVETNINKTDLADQVFYEAQQHFQDDFDNTYYTHYKMPPLLPGNPTSPVLLVGAKSSVVEQYIKIIRSVGLRVGVIDCDVFCLSNMFEYNYGVSNSLSALINVGSSFTQIILIANGQFLFTRDISLGSHEYTRHIAEQLGRDSKIAEEIKVECVINPHENPVSPEVQKIFRDLNDQLVNELKLTIDYYLQSGEAPAEFTQIGQVFLIGGGALTLGLDIAVAAALQVPVRILDPFYNVLRAGSLKGDGITLSRCPTSFGVAVGLALRQLNDNQ